MTVGDAPVDEVILTSDGEASPYPDATPDAPYGFKADGTPYKRHHHGGGPGGHSTPPGAGRQSKTRKAALKGTTDYRDAITSAFTLVAFPLALAGTNSPPLAADAHALTVHAAPVAEALNDLAAVKPEVAAALDRVLRAGPYAALFAAVLPLTMQILANHGAIPRDAARAFGLRPVAEQTERVDLTEEEVAEGVSV